MKKKDDFYFIHSFYAKDVKNENLLAFYKFGNIKVPAIVKQKKILLAVNFILKKVERWFKYN